MHTLWSTIEHDSTDVTAKSSKMWWPETGLNRRRWPFQGWRRARSNEPEEAIATPDKALRGC